MSIAMSFFRGTFRRIIFSATILVAVRTVVLAQVLSGPAIHIQPLPGGFIQLTWPVSDKGYELEIADDIPSTNWTVVDEDQVRVGDSTTVRVPFGTEARFFRLREVELPLVEIASSSPIQGDASVAVTRETIVRFSGQLHPDTVVTPAHYFARAGGDDLDARIHLSHDRRSATLFYSENLPPNARVNVVFNGLGLKDELGREIDADGNGEPGGSVAFHFNTLGFQALEGTAVMGRVYASAKGEGDIDLSLAGVTVTVDGMESTLKAVTDANGEFLLDPSPAGRFFVHIDGRTMAGSQWPEGEYYPYVGKAWEAKAGRTNDVGAIYLPMVRSQTLQTVSEFEDIEINFPVEVIAGNSAFEGVSITVPAGSLFADDGTRGGSVGIAPVEPDRLPGTLPPELQFSIVITVQTDGATNFDQPAPVKFPNLPDPVTGKTLAPGAKTALWSFNHDSGLWEVAGLMTVSADGLYVVSDPGFGILAPGWHSFGGGSPGGSPRPKFKKKNDPEYRDDPFPKRPGEDDCTREVICKAVVSERNLGYCLLHCSGNIFNRPGKKSERSPLEIGFCLGNVITCKDQWETLEDVVGGDRWDNSLSSGQIDCMDECMTPTSATFPAIIPCEGFFDPCPENLVFSPIEIAFLQSAGVVFGLDELEAQILPDWIVEQKAIWKAEADYFSLIFGTPKIAQTDPLELILLRNFLNRFGEITTSDSEEGISISTAEMAGLLALPRVSQFSEAEWSALINRMELMRNNALPPEEYDENAIRAAAQYANDVTQLLLNRGWERREDGLIFGLARLSLETAPEVGSEAFPARGHYYLIRNLESGFELRGRLSPTGSMEGLIFPEDELHLVAYVDPVRLNLGAATFFSSPFGKITYPPTANLSPVEDIDSDSDGLSDTVEQVIGTSAVNADTDNDGVLDGAELKNGSDPLDGIPVATGIVASLQTQGQTVDIAVTSNIAALALSNNGVAIVDVSDPFSPFNISRLALPYQATLVAATRNTLIIAMVGGRLAIVDILNPEQPVLTGLLSFGTDIHSIAAFGSNGYVGLANNHLQKIDLNSGVVVWDWLADGPVGSISISRGQVFLITSGTLQIIGDSLTSPSLTGSIPVAGGIHQIEKGRTLFVGGDFAYVGHLEGYSVIDVRNPALPVIVGVPPSGQLAVHDIVENGSGLTLTTTSLSVVTTLRLSIYDGSDPTKVNPFIAQFDTPGNSRALVVQKGKALVADMTGGMQVINFIGPDLAGIPPQISLEAGFNLIAKEAETRVPTWLRVNALDDHQVRDVEFYIDGELVEVDGEFPFEFSFKPPALTETKTRFTIQANASDLSGLTIWSDSIEIDIVDTLPPQFFGEQPLKGKPLETGTLTEISVFSDELPDFSILTSQTFHVFDAGPDQTLDTGDDIEINGTVSFDPETLKATLTLPSALQKGLHKAVLDVGIKDIHGNALTEAYSWQFEVRDPNQWTAPAGGNWNVAGNWSDGSVPSQDFVIIDVPDADAPTLISTGTYSIARLLSEEDFKLSGGTLNIADNSILNGLFTWTSQSTLGGGGTTFANGGMLLDGSSSHFLDDHWLINNNVAQWTSGAIFLSHNRSLFQNSLGATLEILTNSVVVMGKTTLEIEVLGFINEGTLIKRSNAVTRIVNLPFENLGTIDVELGELEIIDSVYSGGGSISIRPDGILRFGGINVNTPASTIGGSMDIEAGGKLIFGRKGISTLLGSSISGNGEVVVVTTSNAELEIFGSYDVENTSLEGGSINFNSFAKSNSAQMIQASAELAGSGIFETSGEFLWTHGWMAGSGTTRIRGTLLINGNQKKELRDRTLEIFGEATAPAGASVESRFGNRVRIHVRPGGIWRQQDNFEIKEFTNDPVPEEDWLFINEGTFIKEGELDGVINMNFQNFGLIQMDKGNVWIKSNFRQTDGEIRLSDTNFEAWWTNTEFLLQGGRVTGSGGIGFDRLGTIANVQNSGAVISPGTLEGTGGLSVLGHYIQSGNGGIAIDIRAAQAAESSSDKVMVTRSMALGGKLEIRVAQGFTPNIGDVYTIVEGTSRSGEFGTVTGLEIAADRKFQVVYTETSVQMKVIAIP